MCNTVLGHRFQNKRHTAVENQVILTFSGVQSIVTLNVIRLPSSDVSFNNETELFRSTSEKRKILCKHESDTKYSN